MTSIIQKIKNVVKAVINFFKPSKPAKLTTEEKVHCLIHAIAPADCMKCDKEIETDSEYVNLCQACGDEMRESVEVVDTEVTGEDLDMANLHRWGW